MASRELEGLRERLLASKGPDRKVDAFVWAELVGRDVVHRPDAPIGDCHCARSRHAPHDECVLWVQHGERATVENYIPQLTASSDAVIRMIERDAAYRAGPLDFLAECSLHTPPREDFDHARSALPQIARHMLVGYLGAKIALLRTHEAPNV